MANSGRKHQKHRSSRRRLAAISFLSNISLDGTHNDTKLAVYSRKHKGNDVSIENGEDQTAETSTWAGKQLSREITNEASGTGLKQSKKSVNKERPSSGSIRSFLDGNYGSTAKAERTVDVVPFITTGSKRWRTSSLSGDHDRQDIKKKLSHMISDVGVKREIAESLGDRSRCSSSMSENSSESAPKEVRFLSPDTQRITSSGRVYFVSKDRVPVAISSVLPFGRSTGQRSDVLLDELRPKVRHTSGSRSISSSEGLFHIGLQVSARVEEGQDVSYARFLVPARNRQLKRASSDGTAVMTSEGMLHPQGLEVLRSLSHDACTGLRGSHALDRVPEDVMEYYDANILDDPELHCGSYRTHMTFSSYVVSVMDYVKPALLKKELNEKFKERFPNIQLTLTKLRSLKRALKQIAHIKCQIDQWTVAQAYVYFEKLVLKHLINKQNRKLCAGACLLLSCKLNDVKGAELSRLLETIEDVFKLTRKELLCFEIECLVALELCLHVPDMEVFSHYQRLLYNS